MALIMVRAGFSSAQTYLEAMPAHQVFGGSPTPAPGNTDTSWDSFGQDVPGDLPGSTHSATASPGSQAHLGGAVPRARPRANAELLPSWHLVGTTLQPVPRDILGLLAAFWGDAISKQPRRGWAGAGAWVGESSACPEQPIDQCLPARPW